MKITAAFLLVLAVASVLPAGDSPPFSQCELIIDDFAAGIKPGWRNKSFKGITAYTWTRENSRTFVRATSRNAASGLYFEIEFDTQQFPYITWQWKVDNIIANGDESRKSGDDYSARVYVVFPAFFFWNTTAINYIWANKLPKEEAVPNAYTGNAMMIAVESGLSETGKWITETRNIYEDYRRFFGKEPPRAGAIAIMTDTDDTGESASADYGPIAVCRRDPGK